MGNSLNNKSKLLYKDIEQYIHVEKLYLDPPISLQTIADKFNVSSSYMSKLINKSSKCNFNDLINNLRIEAAKKMLLDKCFNQYTIHAIALEAGFKTKASFYSAFKKFTGTTPTAYIKQKNVSRI
ncbi:MAG: helix-turn-helix domain-containing protein [Bacteroidetes bacterium]|nr:helix-turn-helix domain-containing protein [Bacteroidota bacterium]